MAELKEKVKKKIKITKKTQGKTEKIMRLLTPENTGRDIVEKNDRERKKKWNKNGFKGLERKI